MRFYSYPLWAFTLMSTMVIAFVSCCGEEPASVERFVASIQGVWKFESMNMWGAATPPGFSYNLSINGHMVESIIPGDQSLGSVKSVWSGSGPVFSFDVVKNRPDGQQEVVIVGLCKIQEGKLVRIFRKADKGRPKTFNVNDEVDATITVHFREKP